MYQAWNIELFVFSLLKRKGIIPYCFSDIEWFIVHGLLKIQFSYILLGKYKKSKDENS